MKNPKKKPDAREGLEIEIVCFVPENCDADCAHCFEDEDECDNKNKIPDPTAELREGCDPTCFVLTVDGVTCVMTVCDANMSFDDMVYFAAVHNDKVFLRCSSEDVVTLGGWEYLTGTAVIVEIDDDGNECCINADTVLNAMEFFEECVTEIEVDGQFFPAIRLE